MSILDFFRNKPRDKFAKYYQSRLIAFGERRSIEYDANEFLLRIGRNDGAGEVIAYLHNCYENQRKAPEPEREAIIDQFIVGFMELTPEDPVAIRASLRPVVKSLSDIYLYSLRSQVDQGKPFEIPYRNIAGDLVLVLALDTPNGIHLLERSKLESWGIDYEDADKIAIENLRAVTTPSFEQIEAGIWLSQWEDAYDAARLLLPEVFANLPLKGMPVVLMPDRDRLLVTGSEDTQGLKGMVSAANNIREEALRPISGTALILLDGKWQEFIPEGDLGIEFANLSKLYRAQDYAEQKQLLERKFQAENRDVFVATYELRETVGELAYRSMCTLTKGVPSFLPRTGNIAFVSLEEKKIFRARWDEVQRVAPHLFCREDMHPERWFVDAFPTPEELLRMGATKI